MGRWLLSHSADGGLACLWYLADDATAGTGRWASWQVVGGNVGAHWALDSSCAIYVRFT